MSKLKHIVQKAMMSFMSKLTPTCDVVTQKLSQSMDHKLSFRDRIGVKIHLMGCEFCERYRKQLLNLQKMFVKYSVTIDNEDILGGTRLRPEAKEKIKKMIQEEKT